MSKSARSVPPESKRRGAPPSRALGDLTAAQVQRLLATAGDVALVLDADGVIENVVVGSEGLEQERVGTWVGQPWAEVVTVESRDKVAELLRDAGAAAPRWRQVNHPSRGGSDWPVLYAAVRLGTGARAGGRTIAFGRDLRTTEALQLKLLEAQQAMERDYWRYRQAETRWRHLFQGSSEAVLLVDAQTLKVVDANPAAASLLADGGRKLTGAPLSAVFDNPSAKPLQAALTAARAGRRADPVRAELAGGGGRVVASLSSFRQDDGTLLLVRLARARAEGAERGAAAPAAGSLAADFVRDAADAIVFTDADGRIETANPSFIALAQLASEEQARGQRLDRWLGRTGVELSVLIQNLRQRGSVRLFATLLRCDDGTSTEVEVSASTLGQGDRRLLAFCVRDVGRRLGSDARASADVPRSPSELAELVGRVPLKDIVGETTDLIEQLCIEAALRLTGDNRASAAQMLGLSRQALYMKLRRHGLGDLGDEES